MAVAVAASMAVVAVAGIVGCVVLLRPDRPGDLAVGDCIEEFLSGAVVVDVGVVPTVDCAEPHVYEVFHQYAVPGRFSDDGYPGDRSMIEAIVGRCRTVLADLAPAGFERRHDVAALWPDEVGWRAGDRRVSCLLYRMNGSEIVGGPLLKAR
jgi:hypothetical protein